MKTLVFFVAAVVTVQPVLLQTPEILGNSGFIPHQQTIAKVPAILRLQSNLNPDGTFTYTFDTENGISAHAESTITKTSDPGQSIQTVRGQYSYTGPDGVQYTVQYIADQNGYQAFGEHLPTPPPIPEAILRSLEHNAAHPEEEDGVVAATPALAPASNSIPANLNPRSTSTLQLTQFEPLANPSAVPATQSPALATLSKQQQQLAQVQSLQPQQFQPQALQLAHLQPQQFQSQQLQPQQFQLTQLQPQQLQFAQVRPQQLPLAQLQVQQLQPQQLQPQQLQLQQPQPQQLQHQQLQPQQLLPQQFQPQQVQPQQLQPQQLQPQQIQPQDFLTQFAPSFQNFESQRRTSTSV